MFKINSKIKYLVQKYIVDVKKKKKEYGRPTDSLKKRLLWVSNNVQNDRVQIMNFSLRKTV